MNGVTTGRWVIRATCLWVFGPVMPTAAPCVAPLATRGRARYWHEFMEDVLADPDILATLDAPSQAELWQFEPP